MRTAEVQFSEIKLIWSAKYFLGRWDGETVIGGTVDGVFGIRHQLSVISILFVNIFSFLFHPIWL